MTTQERDATVLSMSRQGYRTARIAEVVGVHPHTVSRIRKRAGVAQPKRPNLTADQLRRARVMLEDGCSLTEVGRTLGVTPQALGRRFPGMGWTKRQAADFAVLCRRTGGRV